MSFYIITRYPSYLCKVNFHYFPILKYIIIYSQTTPSLLLYNLFSVFTLVSHLFVYNIQI